ncbi:MAG: toll/interleukin-1 receptor domain-containing protein [Bacteroidetes bacterium]|nr:toll/interleukin-1 receptor domain-containing protein [Bacteroidota bacterium]
MDFTEKILKKAPKSPFEKYKLLKNLEINAEKYFDLLFNENSGITLYKNYTITTKYKKRILAEKKIRYVSKCYFIKHNGVKQKTIIIENLGKKEAFIHAIAQDKYYDDPHIVLSGPKSNQVPSDKMTMSPKIFIYTNKLYGPIEDILSIFKLYQPDIFIEIIDESMILKTLFISFGEPDKDIASRINATLKAKGVLTYFFPDDSMPGEKLHRVMSEGVSNYDKTLLICSKKSISRNGVLNEIERMLEREAKEGGTEIIIPITLDDYIFTEWNPKKKDIKQQITARVVRKLDDSNFDSEIDRVIKVLRK